MEMEYLHNQESNMIDCNRKFDKYVKETSKRNMVLDNIYSSELNP
jgi:hypothetical protein